VNKSVNNENKKRILIVDDEADTCITLGRFFSRMAS